MKVLTIWLCFCLGIRLTAGCGTKDGPCIVNGPSTRGEQLEWLNNLKADRTASLKKINYTGGVFDQLKWTQSAWIQPQMHPYDRYFYDPVTHNYTVQKYLQDLKDRYGGVDAILMWPTYTNIGIDDRNQFDFFRTMPGGLEGVKRATDELKASGVRVLWPYNPWDHGTRREPLDDEHTFAKLLKETHGDGFNGDTMGFVPHSFWKASKQDDYPLAFEPEGGGKDASLNWQTFGWGYWKYPTIPVVDRFKFLTKGKFMTNVCDRWAFQKTDNLQMAWFNGDGYESWENVWGTWNGITPYDGEAIRRVGTMLRFLGKAGFLHSPEWIPHTPEVSQDNVFASKWPVESASLWTIVNRGQSNLTVTFDVQGGSMFYYDCYHGVEIKAVNQAVKFSLEARGFGCIIESNFPADQDMKEFLQVMNKLTQRSLYSYSAVWKYELQTMLEMPKTKLASTAPVGRVAVPKGNFMFVNKGVMIEGDDQHGVDLQYPWEDHPSREHSHNLEIDQFYIDKYPVTNANYADYLKATGFKPSDTSNWLKNWNGSETPSAALASLPVTYVSLGEARAYCAWAGARLPHSYEWQYAAQGTDGRTYPWGNDNDQSRYPKEQNGNTCMGPESVTAHSPAGDSPFGVSDLVGNVWQYTDEFSDDHTRSVVLMGGSNYYPLGSHWYFPQAKKLNTHNKYFLMDDRYERAATIGFRCASDSVDDAQIIV